MNNLENYVGKLTDKELAAHLKAYVLCASMYGLPTYLIALLHEASQRIKSQTEGQP